MAKRPSFDDITDESPPENPRHEGQYGPSVKRSIPGELIRSVSRVITGAPPDRRTSGSGGLDIYRIQDAEEKVAPPPPVVPAATDPADGPWMGPGVPMRPIAGRPADVVGREYSYQSGQNLQSTPRATEQVGFSQLRALAQNYDLISILIETRKSQMAKVRGKFLPRQQSGQEVRAPADTRCQELDTFFLYPDGRLPFVTWQRKLLADLFEIDAPSVYVRRDLLGRPARLEIMDGTTIVPRIDTTGRYAEPPLPAFTQVLNGGPTYNYRADELVYFPRNLRPGRLYGYSPVEQIIMTVLIGLRREAAKFNHYAQGNIPDALIQAPGDWSGRDIADFQKIFDARLADPRRRFGRAVFIPGGSGAPILTRSEQYLFGQFDEWLARICCYAFDLPPLPFVQQQNRSTAETSNEAALQEGLESIMIWWKAFMDHIANKIFGYEDLEYVFDDTGDVKPIELVEAMLPAQAEGIVSGDELRTDTGREKIGLRHLVKGVGPLGFMFVDDMIKASELGLTLYGPTGPPQPQPVLGPDGMPVAGAPTGVTGAAGPGAPGIAAPAAGAPPTPPGPDLADTLSGVPQDLLDAVGLGAGGASTRSVDVTGRDEADSDPLYNVVPHPQVARTLRQAEAHIQKLRSRGR